MIFKYVVHGLIPSYEELGWASTGSLRESHHGFHAELMEWRGGGEPQEPQEVIERRSELAALAQHMAETDRSF